MNRLVLVAVVASSPLAVACAQRSGSAQSAVDKVLHTPAYHQVHATEANGVVTLTGSVALLKEKLDAEAKVAQLHGVRAVRDEVRVAGPAVDDAALQGSLLHQVHTHAVSIYVHQGVATLGGHSVDPLIAWNAVSKVASTPGVQGIVDNIRVGTSAEARAWAYAVHHQQRALVVALGVP